MSKGVSIQEDGFGRRISNVRRILTDSQNGKVSWVPLPLTNQKFISKNGMYLATLDDLDGYSKIRVNVPGGVAGTTRPTDPLQPIEVIPNMPSMYEGSSVAGIDLNTQLPLGYEVLPDGSLKANGSEPRAVEKTGMYVCKVTGTASFQYDFHQNNRKGTVGTDINNTRAYIHVCTIVQSDEPIELSTHTRSDRCDISFYKALPVSIDDNLNPFGYSEKENFFTNYFNGDIIAYTNCPTTQLGELPVTEYSFIRTGNSISGTRYTINGLKMDYDSQVSIFVPNRLHIKIAGNVYKYLVTVPKKQGYYYGNVDIDFFRNDNGVNGVKAISGHTNGRYIEEFIDINGHITQSHNPNITNDGFYFHTEDFLLNQITGTFSRVFLGDTPVPEEPAFSQQYTPNDSAHASIECQIYYNEAIYCGKTSDAPEQAFTLL